jgi:hypothetical protein
MASVPWAEIRDDDEDWLEDGCWDPENDFMDPSKLKDREARSIYQHLHTRQKANKVPIKFIKSLERDLRVKLKGNKSSGKSTKKAKQAWVEVESSDDDDDDDDDAGNNERTPANTPVSPAGKRKRNPDPSVGEDAGESSSPPKKKRVDAKGKGKEREKTPNSVNPSSPLNIKLILCQALHQEQEYCLH